MSVTESVMRGVIRTLGALPPAVQNRLAGGPVEVDGQRLHPEVAMALRLLALLPGSDFDKLPLAKARHQVDEEARVFGAVIDVPLVEDSTLPGPAGPLPVRIYRPTVRARGLVVYFHGGGWVVGGLDSADTACRFIADRTELTVISVDYRLAPEAPFPAAVDDAIAAYRAVREQASRWARRGAPIAVAGDSAGGNLAAVVARQCRDDEAGAPDYQLLFFPVTDLSTKHRSYELFSTGFFLTEDQMDWYRDHYLPTPDVATDPRASPLLATDLSGVAPAHVAVSGFDVLRDEGLAYAQRLLDAGVSTTVQQVTGHIHAFVNATGVGRTSVLAFDESCRALIAGLRAKVPS